MSEPTLDASDRLDRLVLFLTHLSAQRIAYELMCERSDGIMVRIRTPVQMWEIEFMTSDWKDVVQIERLKSDGVISGDERLTELYHELEISVPPTT